MLFKVLVVALVIPAWPSDPWVLNPFLVSHLGSRWSICHFDVKDVQVSVIEKHRGLSSPVCLSLPSPSLLEAPSPLPSCGVTFNWCWIQQQPPEPCNGPACHSTYKMTQPCHHQALTALHSPCHLTLRRLIGLDASWVASLMIGSGCLWNKAELSGNGERVCLEDIRSRGWKTWQIQGFLGRWSPSFCTTAWEVVWCFCNLHVICHLQGILGAGEPAEPQRFRLVTLSPAEGEALSYTSGKWIYDHMSLPALHILK